MQTWANFNGLIIYFLNLIYNFLILIKSLAQAWIKRYRKV